jgi:hypothetical protein
MGGLTVQKEIVEVVVPTGIDGGRIAEDFERFLYERYGKQVRAWVRKAS